MIPPVSDIHTHNPAANDAVINLDCGAGPQRPGALYSVGWHPWWPLPMNRAWLERMATHPQVVLIGECGVDTKRGSGTMAEQLTNLEWQAELAERVGKPLLLHMVGGWNEVMALRRRLNAQQPWIVHGFRGKPELARQLVAHGFYISLGAKYNQDVPGAIPPERLLRETDEN